MIGRPEVDPRTGEPTRGAAMLHILKHGSTERQSRTAARPTSVLQLLDDRLLVDLADRGGWQDRHRHQRVRARVHRDAAFIEIAVQLG